MSRPTDGTSPIPVVVRGSLSWFVVIVVIVIIVVIPSQMGMTTRMRMTLDDDD